MHGFKQSLYSFSRGTETPQSIFKRAPGKELIHEGECFSVALTLCISLNKQGKELGIFIAKWKEHNVS